MENLTQAERNYFERQPTLRDQFAGLAVAGIIQMNGHLGADSIAVKAYEVADAMMAERKKNAGR